jgi:hypothetical protein
MNYFDSDMSNITNMVVYSDWKIVLYYYICEQCRTQFILPISSQRQLINTYFYDGKVSHICFYDGNVSRIDGASATILPCLHVLVARRMLLILDMLIVFSENRRIIVNNSD